MALAANLAILIGTVVVAGMVLRDRIAARRNLASSANVGNTHARAIRFEAVWQGLTTISGRMYAVLLSAGVVMIGVGQLGFIESWNASLSWLVWFAGLALIAVLALDTGAEEPARSSSALKTIGRQRWPTIMTGAVAVVLVISSIAIWGSVPDRDVTDSSLDIVLLWFLSIVTLLSYVAIPESAGAYGRLRTWSRRNHHNLLIAAGLLTFATVIRLVNLSGNPWALSGDEGTFAVTARSSLEGQIRNPFSSGPWGYPSLLFILQGWPIEAIGNSVGSARTLSALFGVGSVVASYALIRHHFDTLLAAAAGVLVATFNFHVFWSRDAQNAAAPMFFFPVALLLLDKALLGRSRMYGVLAGFTIAFAQFFHPANRLLIFVALAYAAFALMQPVPRTMAALEYSARGVPPIAAWTALAIVIGQLPLLAYFSNNRTEFWSRTNEVSVFASGWLDRETEITGDSKLAIMWRQFEHAAMLPFSIESHGHFRPDVPFVSWPLAVPVAIGLAVATIRCWDRRYFPVALSFWMLTVGLAFTAGPPETNRYVTAAPFLGILSALGIGFVVVFATRRCGIDRSVAIPVTGAIVALIAIWHLNFTFHDPNQVEIYSDANTQIANTLAREVEQVDPEAKVYLSGSPRIYYYGFQTLPYIVPDAMGVDVEPPWNGFSAKPDIDGTTIFAFVPERLGELDVVSTWFPDGTTVELQLDDGRLLYVSYIVDEPATSSNGKLARYALEPDRLTD